MRRHLIGQVPGVDAVGERLVDQCVGAARSSAVAVAERLDEFEQPLGNGAGSVRFGDGQHGELVHQLVVVRPARGQQPDGNAEQPNLVQLLVGGAAAVVATERGGPAGAHRSAASQSMPTKPAQGSWLRSSVNCTVLPNEVVMTD